MAFWNKYPYSDFHELNLDWIIKTIIDYKSTIVETVNKWIENNPEALTTIEDNSITLEKFNDSVYLDENDISHIIEYHTPPEHNGIVNGEALSIFDNEKVIQNFKTGYDEKLSRFQDWYVDGISGDDSNNGKSTATPFRTLKRALEEAKQGDIECRIKLLGGQTYDLTAINFTSLALHFSCYGSGNVNIVFNNYGTRVAFYNCHLNMLGTAGQKFNISGEGIYFDGGAVQIAYTTLETSFTSYGASLRTQNSVFNDRITLYNCGAMIENCTVTNIVGNTSKIYLNTNVYKTHTTIDDTDRILQFTNCITSFVGTENVLDRVKKTISTTFNFVKIFGGSLYWRGAFSTSGTDNTMSLGLSANTGNIVGRPDYFTWLDNNSTTGIDLQYNSTCVGHLKQIYNGQATLGEYTTSSPFVPGRQYLIRSKINSGTAINNIYCVANVNGRIFLKEVYGASSLNIKAIEVEISPNQSKFTINSNRAYYVPTEGNMTVTTYTNETAIENNSYISAIYEVE